MPSSNSNSNFRSVDRGAPSSLQRNKRSIVAQRDLMIRVNLMLARNIHV